MGTKSLGFASAEGRALRAERGGVATGIRLMVVRYFVHGSQTMSEELAITLAIGFTLGGVLLGFILGWIGLTKE